MLQLESILLKDIQVFIGIFIAVGSAIYFFIKLYIDHRAVIKKSEAQAEAIGLVRSMVDGVQEKSRENHEQLMKQLELAIKEQDSQRHLLESRFENQRLKDREETTREIHKIADALNSLSTGVAQLNTSNGHILSAIQAMQDEKGKQQDINMKLYEQLAQLNKK